MKLTLFLIVLSSLKAQESQAVAAARHEMERVQWLIKTGSLPKAKMADAQLNLDDATDEAVLEKTLYGFLDETDEQQASEMLRAAQNRVDRQRAKVTKINNLIAKDLASPAERADLERELSSREDALQQAAVRAALLRERAGMARAEAIAAPGLAEEKPAAIT